MRYQFKFPGFRLKPIRLMGSTFFHEEKIKSRLAEFILRSDRLSMFEKCREFETAFARYQGAGSAILYNSGSSANLALLQALINLGRLKKGDRVGVSAVTWATNPMPVMQLGLEAVPIDVELDTLNVSSRLFQQALEDVPGIKAFFITNLLGLCDDIDRIARLARDAGVILIEDNCESLGTVYQGRKLGNFGVASTFSLFVGHHLSAIEGGIICTSDLELANMATMVRAHGWARSLSEARRRELRAEHGVDEFYEQYTFYEMGYNLRPTEITGFLGLTQLEYADEIIELREKNFERFYEASRRIQSIHHLRVGHIELLSNFAFPVVCRDAATHRDMLERFKARDVEIRPLVAGNIVRQPFFKKHGGMMRKLQNSDLIHDLGFYFPNHPELSDEEIAHLNGCLLGC